jgi:hypothetical protein
MEKNVHMYNVHVHNQEKNMRLGTIFLQFLCVVRIFVLRYADGPQIIPIPGALYE